MTYDEAKEESLRMLDEDRWKWSLWEAQHKRRFERMVAVYVLINIAGVVVIRLPAHLLLMMLVGLLTVWSSYRKYYGIGKDPFARLRSLLRSRL